MKTTIYARLREIKVLNIDSYKIALYELKHDSSFPVHLLKLCNLLIELEYLKKNYSFEIFFFMLLFFYASCRI